MGVEKRASLPMIRKPHLILSPCHPANDPAFQEPLIIYDKVKPFAPYFLKKLK